MINHLGRRFVSWVSAPIQAGKSLALQQNQARNQGRNQAKNTRGKAFSAFFSALASGAMLALPGGLTDRVLAETPPSPPPVSTVLPNTVPAVVFLNTNEAAWQSLRQFTLFPSDIGLPGDLLLNSWLGIDFQKDIRPWLGDQVALVFLPLPDAKTSPPSLAPKAKQPPAPQDSSPPPSFRNEEIILLSATVKDRSLIPTLIKKLETLREQPSVRRQYQGITLFEWKPEAVVKPVTGIPPEPPEREESEGPTLAIALVSDQLLIAQDGKAIEQVIDAQTKLNALIGDAKFQRSLANPHAQEALVWGYINVGPFFKLITAWNEAALAELGSELPIPVTTTNPKVTELVEATYDSVDLFVWVAPKDGIYAQSNTHLAKDFPQGPLGLSGQPVYRQNPSQILSRLPGSTYEAVNSNDLSLVWREIIASFEAEPALKKELANFRQYAKTQVGLDDRDVFPWMDGEFALFLFPAKGGLFSVEAPFVQLAAALAVQTSQRALAEAALLKVDQFVSKNWKEYITVTTRPVKGQSFTSWELKEGKQPISVLAYGWTDSNTLMVTTGIEPMAELAPKPFVSLPQSSTFNAAIQPLPSPNSGYFYINVGSSLSFVFNTIVPQFLSARDYAPDGYRRIGSMSRAQQAYYLENNVFAEKIELLGLGIDSDGPTHVYRIVPAKDFTKRVVMTAQAKTPTERSYTAAVYLASLPEGEATTISQVCETPQPSNKLPGVPKLVGNAIVCAPGSRPYTRVPPVANTPPKLPPEVEAVQRQLSSMRSFSATSSLGPRLFRADAVLKLTPR